MTLYQRIKNLWKLSEVDITIKGDKLTIGQITTTIERPHSMAQIIRREDLAKKFIQND